MKGNPYGITPNDIDLIRSESFVRTVDLHRELPSTNDLALERATFSELETPLLVLAERQTAGRGRGDNQWWSAPGALTFSLVLDRQAWDLTGASDARLSLTTGLAVYDALRDFAPRSDIRLKWPNDVYLDGRKVVGILLERSSIAPNRIVVGVGVNVNNSLSTAPDDVRARATSICDAIGESPALGAVLLRILMRLSVRYRMLAANDPNLVVEQREACFLRNRTVEVISGNRLVKGECRGIDEEGALMIQTSSGLERLFSGVVNHVGG